MSQRNLFAALITACLIASHNHSPLFAQTAAPPSWKTIQRGCAQANLELAEARLAAAMSQKEQVADSVSDETLDALQSGVDAAKDELAQLASSKPANPFQPKIAAAEKNLRALEADLAKSQEANRLQSGSVTDLELRTAKAEVAVAKARLAALRALNRQPTEVRLQWQIEQLQNEIRSLWARPLIED